jgi:hypothetical protein
MPMTKPSNLPTAAAPMRNEAWPMGRDAQGRFLAGGPGRPMGSRNRMSAQAGRWLLSDFGDHRHELLPRMRRWFLPQYLALIGRMLPREVDMEGGDGAPDLAELGPEQLAALVVEASAMLRRVAAREGGTAEADAADTQDEV